MAKEDMDKAKDKELTKKPLDENEKYVLHISLADLTEATIDSEKNEVVVTALQQGWSKNDNFYSKQVAESLAKHLESKKKVYINHQMRPGGDTRYLGGRDMRDWAAQVIEAWGENGSTKARLKIFEEPDGWIMERIKTCPEEVGLSIDAKAYVKKGEVAGKKGIIVEEFIRLSSLDFVPTPSAGGRVERIAAMEQGGETKLFDTFLNALFEMEETVQTKALKNFFNKIEEGDEPEELFKKLVAEISKTEYDPQEYPFDAYAYVPDKKKPTTWRFKVKIYDDGKLKLDKLQLHYAVNQFRDFLMWYKDSIPADDIPTIKSNFLRFYNELKIKDKDIPSVIKESVIENGGETNVENLKEITLDQLLSERPDIIDKVKEVFEKESKDKKENEKMVIEIADLKKTIEAKDTEISGLKTKVDEYEVKEKFAEREEVITTKIKEATLDEKLVTAIFKDSLRKAKDAEEMDKLIADRKSIVESTSGKVEGVGKDTKKIEEKPKVTKDDLEKAFK